ncbi:MAG: PAS domain S-box protein [Bacteroidales bacterium]|nr:PAS domain S-box protein [Bacteroidales bacterium]
MSINDKNTSKLSIKNNKFELKQALKVALWSLLIPVIAYIIEILVNDVDFTLGSIYFIHQHNPSLYIVDILPIILFVLTFKIYSERSSEKSKFYDTLKEKEEKINTSAKFAKLIGEGDFSFDIGNIDNNDNLTQSLLLMRENLLKTNEKEAEQYWIAKGRDQISNILRLHNNLEELAFETLKSLINYINVTQGAFYYFDEDEASLKNIATYAYGRKKYLNQDFKIGQGLVGQAAYEMATIYRTEIPDYYITISSGILGDKKPSSLLIVPLISDDKLQGIIEFASVDEEIPSMKIKFIEQLSNIIAQTVFNLKVNSRTERLLTDAQKMTEELKENEEELKQNAEEMKATHEELEKTNANLETKIKEVENAQKKMHSLLENASEIISIYDRNQKLVYMSPSVTNILGYTPEEMMDGKDIDRLTAKGQKDIATMFNMILENPNKSETIQYIYMKKNNDKIHIETTGRNLLDDSAINGIILNSQDITARKKAEQEERMKSKMQALSENSLDMIVRIGLQGKFFYMNPIFEKLTGIHVQSAINKSFDDVGLNESIKKIYLQVIESIRSTVEKINIEVEFPTISGEIRIMSIDAIPEFGDDKELETILIVAHDVTEQKLIENEIKEKNRAITESINYAYRIQTAILPDNKLIRQRLPNSFMFYLPRDVVSGDFPWFFEKDDLVYIAVVDCTGHGVRGALLSFIGYFLLNNIVDHDADYTAGEICDRLHAGVRSTLKQDREDADARDGMDIAFCKINFKKKELQYAGAHRPLFHLSGSEFLEYKGDRKAIGGIPHGKKPEQNFTNYSINYKDGDRFYFFSDGLPDQVGGEDARKYQAKQIRDGILAHADKPLVAYLNFLKKDFSNWKAEKKQIDDVLLIGLEL